MWLVRRPHLARRRTDDSELANKARDAMILAADEDTPANQRSIKDAALSRLPSPGSLRELMRKLAGDLCANKDNQSATEGAMVGYLTGS